MSRYNTEEAREKHRAEQRSYYDRNRSRILKSMKEWRKKNHDKYIYKAARNKYRKKYKLKFPEKHRAHWILWNAVSRGHIIKPKQCESCGAKKRLEGHHEDYSKPLEVKWLCNHCHREIHGRN